MQNFKFLKLFLFKNMKDNIHNSEAQRVEDVSTTGRNTTRFFCQNIKTKNTVILKVTAIIISNTSIFTSKIIYFLPNLHLKLNLADIARQLSYNNVTGCLSVCTEGSL